VKEIKDREQLNYYLQLHQLESVFHDPLLLHLSLYSFDAGEFICSQGQELDYVYVLVKGKLKIYTTSEEGRTLIISFKNPLEVIGDIEYVQGTDIINTVEAVSSVLMIGVHHRWLNQFGKEYPPLLHFLLDIITRKFYSKSNSMTFNLLHPVDVRLASYLLSVFFDDSDSAFKGKLSTSSLKDAANLIGTSYRHLNRVIQQFCVDGLIERSEGFILVKDREGLSERANQNMYK
jgi:CRP-like cAMP-binding protein